MLNFQKLRLHIKSMGVDQMIEVNSVAIDGMSIIFVAKLRLMKITMIKKIKVKVAKLFCNLSRYKNLTVNRLHDFYQWRIQDFWDKGRQTHRWWHQPIIWQSVNVRSSSLVPLESDWERKSPVTAVFSLWALLVERSYARSGSDPVRILARASCL